MSEELKSVGGEFKGFTSREKAEAAVTIEVTTGLGKKYGLRIDRPNDKPVLIAVHL